MWANPCTHQNMSVSAYVVKLQICYSCIFIHLLVILEGMSLCFHEHIFGVVQVVFLSSSS